MRPRKTLVLGLLLLLPVLGFLFLYGFGKNRYALPTYLPDRVDSAQVGGRWQRDTVFHQIRPYRLFSSVGRSLSSTELGRGMYVAQFADGSPDSRRVSRALLRVQEKFRHEPQVKLLTFVLDPGPDPGLDLMKRAATYGAIAGKWMLLTGPADSLQQLINHEFRLAANPKKFPDPLHPIKPANLLPGQLLLIDRYRRVRGVYDGLDGREIDRLLTEITVQLYDDQSPR